jgi:hypothetical protein
MNLQEQLAIQAMYDAGIEREKKAKADKPKPTLGPVAALSEASPAPVKRGRPRKAAQ